MTACTGNRRVDNNVRPPGVAGGGGGINCGGAALFERYLRHGEINDYLDRLALAYPDSVRVETCGRSFEGRELKSISIQQAPQSRTAFGSRRQLRRSSLAVVAPIAAVPPKKSPPASTSACLTGRGLRKRRSKSSRQSGTDCSGGSGGSSSGGGPVAGVSQSLVRLSEPSLRLPTIGEKPIVLIDGGIHAREWISVATALFCIYQLVELGAKNADLLGRLDFCILPVVNADGYEYSHTNHRMWRKSRQPVLNNITQAKNIGADCNRNFDYHWSSACARPSRYTFRGPRPFSEPETRMLRSIMHTLGEQCRFYLTLHSHAQAFMYPWGYTRDRPQNWKDLHSLAKAGHTAIKEQTGKYYRCGSVALLIKHTAAGGSPDYAFGKVKIPYAMTMELSGAGYGFDPPCEVIGQLVEESWIGIRAMCAHVAEKE